MCLSSNHRTGWLKWRRSPFVWILNGLGKSFHSSTRWNFPSRQVSTVYQKACELSASLNQHLFDTLYHAVAMTELRAMLVTADEHYYRKAHNAGRIVRLKEYSLTSPM